MSPKNKRKKSDLLRLSCLLFFFFFYRDHFGSALKELQATVVGRSAFCFQSYWAAA